MNPMGKKKGRMEASKNLFDGSVSEKVEAESKTVDDEACL